MNTIKRTFLLKWVFYLVTALMSTLLNAQINNVIVDVNGAGDFKTIQEAINSLPQNSESDRVVFIKNGVYKEQILIEKNHIVLKGEHREETIITGEIAHLVFKKKYPDNKYSGIVNLEGNDITITNLTIENTYGRFPREEFEIEYLDTKNGDIKKETVKRRAHQFALRSFNTTRLIVTNCTIRAWGADTVSPWNAENGMYYFKDCTLQGGTDFYCPRGWSYAENCTFIVSIYTSGALWHDGSKNVNMKSVLKDCKFIGLVPYKLGRYHRDAQMYLVNATFDELMEDKEIYKTGPVSENFPTERIYYYNCHRKGADFDWYKNNLDKVKGGLSVNDINVQWTFDGMWDPTKK
jgi:pectinesterase